MTEQSNNTKLFQPGHLGDVAVKNRVFMAPLTRNRAHADGTPHELSAEYYAQRASAGLIVSEATQIDPLGKGYLDTPGIYNASHVAAWLPVTQAVHERGGKIFSQVWHVGRISHVSLLPEGEVPVAPSAVAAQSQTFTTEGFVDVSAPRALTLDEIKGLPAKYVASAKLAIDAGFDGVEIHGANGYLLNQFIATNSNLRTDEYGGSVEKRARLLFEVIDAVADAIGAGRVGVRLSPTGAANDMKDAAAAENYRYIYEGIAQRGLAYLHVVEAFPGADANDSDVALLKELRDGFDGNYIANGGFDAVRAEAWLETGTFAVAFGRPFISNPDLPERIQAGAGLTDPDPSTFFGGGAKGYTDYPRLQR